jgi:hypothetical protein
MTKRYVAVLVLGIAGLSLALAAAIAQGDGTTPAAGYPQVTTIEEEAQDAVAVLDEPQTTTDEMPTEIAEGLDDEAPFGMNPDLSRRPIGSISNSVFIVPADGHICLAVTNGDAGAALSCPDTEDVANGEAGAATMTLEGNAIGVYGLVPDGVDTVTVTIEGDAPEVIEVEDNAYFAGFPEGTLIETIGYSGPSGEVEFPIYDPTVVFEE